MRNKFFIFWIVLLSAFFFADVRFGYAEISTLRISEDQAKEIEATPGKSSMKDFNRKRNEFADKYGTRFAFLLNYAQQVILRNKQDVGNSRGLWYMNLDISQQLWKGSRFIMELEVDKNKGIDKFIPTYSKFNANSGNNSNLYLPYFYLDQKLFEDRLSLVAGKLDLSDWFDGNEVANSADVQFLSSALVDSATIPFPAKGVGAMASFKLHDWFYVQTGASTAEAIPTKTGFSDGFNSTLFLSEFGFSPTIGELKGNYRFIYYLLHKKSEWLVDDDQTKNDQYGVSLSFDQAVSERVSLFLRYGFADPKLNEIAYAWSTGVQFEKPFPGRAKDYCAFAVTQNILSRDYRIDQGSDITASRETMLEAYYSFAVNEILTLTADCQAALDPNADMDAANPVIASLRALVAF